MRSRPSLPVRTGIALAVLSLLAGPAPFAATSQLDLSRLVIVGDSLSAGYQSGSLHEQAQVNSYAAFIASQAGAPLDLPLVAEPGIPNKLQLLDPGPPPVITPVGGVSTGRIDPLLQPTNLAVPGHTVHNALATRPDCTFAQNTGLVTNLVLGLPACLVNPMATLSQVELAEALQPTAVFVWLGNNDVLGAALAGDPSLIIPTSQFEADYVQIMDRMEATGATLVVANIPDIPLPYFTPVEAIAFAAGVDVKTIQLVSGVPPRSLLTPAGVTQLGAMLAGFIPGPLAGQYFLSPAEVDTLRTRIAEFNGVIATEAASHGATLVDMRSAWEKLARKGFRAGGQTLNTRLLGGIFSLDGIHPTNTGYAILANKWIKDLNKKFNAGIPKVHVGQVKASDPLIFPSPLRGEKQPAPGFTDEAMQNLRSVLIH